MVGENVCMFVYICMYICLYVCICDMQSQCVTGSKSEFSAGVLPIHDREFLLQLHRKLDHDADRRVRAHGGGARKLNRVVLVEVVFIPKLYLPPLKLLCTSPGDYSIHT